MDFFIKDKGILVGSASVDVGYSLAWELDSINVHTNYQGMGFGTILMQAVCAFVDRNKKDIELIVGSGGPMTNAELEAWYARFGFQKVSIGMRRYFKEKEKTDVDQTGVSNQVQV